MSDLDLDVAPAARATSPPPPPPTPKKSARTHHAYARLTLDRLEVKGWKPVFHQGQLHLVDEGSGLWLPFEREELVTLVAEMHDGQSRCSKSSDYAGIADHALALAADSSFFRNAPVGIACAGSFYRVKDDQVLAEPFGAHHRQRVMLDFEPLETPTPLFDCFLHETFASDTLIDEEQQQRRLVQEIAGAAMLGVMPQFHKAVLFYDPYGRAGKGTLERIIRQLVPTAFTSAVSPFKWDNEYYLAGLAGSRLNVVGELEEGAPIPSANFKSVIGGDLLAGRQPTRPVITFHNEAAHIFTSNHLIATRDHSEAFYSRWLLVEFPNSLLRSQRPLDTALAARIISQELPGIAYWALQGAVRLLKQGAFSVSSAHDRLMAQWRRSSNSIDEFIHECCLLSQDVHERRSFLYGSYKAWCTENGRKAQSNAQLKQFMEHRVGLAVRFAVLDGYDVVRGIAMRDEVKAGRFGL